LSDGISESLINTLSRLPSLRVIPRGSSFHYKGREAEPSAVARQLGVRTMVTGRVTRRGEVLLIGAELVDARENRQLWGEQYSRAFGDILALQEEIARRISENLRLRLTGEQKARLGYRATADPEAYRLYLLGYHHVRRLTRDDVQKGIGYFRQALALDGKYAPAYSGLAYSYLFGMADWYAPAREVFPLGKEAAAQAIALDPSLAEGHSLLGIARVFNDYDWAGGEQEARKAAEIDPSDSLARMWYAWLLAMRGDMEAALREILRAQELDPLSSEINQQLGILFYFGRRYDDAIRQFRRTLELEPSYFWAEMVLAQSYQEKRQFPEGLAALERARRITAATGETPPEILSALTRNHALSGNRAAASKALEELLALNERRYVSRHDIAVAYLSLGEKEQALDWLEKAYEDRNWWMTLVKLDPRLDGLRSEPRFQDLVRRIGPPA
jgi:TolB-like protein/Flp pilus assembly protein TadD